ncbi:DJ-1/PfpI family protein [Corynebacterium heidelbergense]|uniref:DJ-1/PfpI family protein n=1 Tax=Corynebacterium heidelbergense TaxID=2055947 RepID=A0A364VEG3_9CORY|nr:DJ-1/PfpI family protein [Corynebacterium heidelbergense]RAV35039.1 DJ-1/PfpI family protein [Corynebacterium heidelbergense]WCZ37411.1 Isonitrile hydratase [Corynebacterium heidelbergense]
MSQPSAEQTSHGVERRGSIVLFDGFEALDAFGPADLIGHVPSWQVEYVGVHPERSPVRSAQGFSVIPTASLDDLRASTVVDILLVPGGPGTRLLVNNDHTLQAIAALGERASVVSSVCTGAALLARAGLLDHLKATSNKMALDWVSSQSSLVDWQTSARWVVDANRWTSSGVAAGMDMTYALIAHYAGEYAAATAARCLELNVQRDPLHDPFSAEHG